MDVEQFLIGERPGQRVVARDASHRFESVVSVVLRCDWIVAQRVLLGSRCGVALRDGGDRVVATSSEPHADVESGASVSLSIRGSDGVVLNVSRMT